MCGFVSIMGEKELSIHTLEEMNQLIDHRGPDDEGYVSEKHMKCGFKRLSIIGVESGHQPMRSVDGRYTIVFNGEIYNYLELKAELIKKGYSFTTESDTEVLLTLYMDEKENGLRKLRGMFSFVIWDKEREELFAARDYFGIKPLFYCENEESLYLASEAKSLLHVMRPTVDDLALQHYLTFQYVPEPDTIDQSIKKLPPGHYLKKKVGGPLTIEKYWGPSFQTSDKSYDYYKDKLRETLRNSVNIHMRSDVPVGSFLSGGIDSTAIVALAREVNPAIQTYTVGFLRDGYSEVDLVKETASALGVKNHHSYITAEQFVSELRKIVWHMDEPVADPAAIPLYFVAKEAARDVKVVLSGEGADELFAGYNIYREPRSLAPFSLLSAKQKKILHGASRYLPDSIKGKNYIQRGCIPLAERYIGNAKLMTEREKQAVLKHYDPNQSYTNITGPIFNQINHYDDVKKMQMIDLYTWLRGDILVKADKMTMAHSLELRVPFLDKEVFSIAREIPTNFTIAKKTTKYILRDALESVVPKEALMRKKLGFPVPIKHWLKAELYEWAQETIIESKTEHLFHKDQLLKLLEAHREGKIDYSRKLWAVLIFMIWHSIFVEGAPVQLEENKSKELISH
ncbi:asparagine synthase (glutamine-hydrolyzing) [Alkalihalophilus lindianensis]|uniref:asparagine synthase (glutamine-hydrolyzing) n=1 Tax=Alkalihalophilus lindianensis TaxID=1630542 RepID=A0ABU3XF33_9BACI|nr:asparagine synthase (glutamine-hydrolyzing) [Alkalihalophilus lindianensis]MDV2686496.1 asparagine synthase (glutamine-hydrolyzing) [Alkalihalophilus lindianensis]